MKGSSLYDKVLRKNGPTRKNDNDFIGLEFAGVDFPIAHDFADDFVQKHAADFLKVNTSILLNMEQLVLEPHESSKTLVLHPQIRYGTVFTGENTNLRTSNLDQIDKAFSLPCQHQYLVYTEVPSKNDDSVCEAFMTNAIGWKEDLASEKTEQDEKRNCCDQFPEKENASEMSFVPMSICERTRNVQMAKDNLQAIWKEISSKQPKLPLAEPGKRETLEEGEKQEYMTSGGERIHIYDCELILPENCFKEQTNVSVTVEVDSSKWPDGYVGISPMIHVNSERKFEKPATVNLPTWCTSDGSELSKHRTVHVLHKPNDGDEWEVLCQLPLALKREQCSLKFECMDFSPVFVGILENECGNSEEYTLTGVIYKRLGGGNISQIVFYFDSVANWDIVKERYNIPKDREPINPIDVMENDNIKGIWKSDKVVLKPASFLLTINKSFIRTPRCAKSSIMKKKKAEEKVIGFDVTVKIKKNEEDLYKVPVHYNWDNSDEGEQSSTSEQNPAFKKEVIVAKVNKIIIGNNTENTAGMIVGENGNATVTNKNNKNWIAGGPQSNSVSLEDESMVDPESTGSEEEGPSQEHPED